MSEVLGIIGEYNPFHNGHLYHIAKSKEESGAEFVICVISGNFVQRGDTSIVNKWAKAKMALANGADLVIELPTVYSISSAENFAQGAIKILNSLKIVDTISFGMETDDVAILNNIANVLYNEPKEYTTMLAHELKKGNSFPKARENALMMYLNDIKKYVNVLSGSNNILGVEYLKALKKTKSHMIPMGVKRQKVLYNDEYMVDEFASATSIRRMLKTREFDDIRRSMPKSSYQILGQELKQGHYVIDLSCFEKEIIYTLRKMSQEEIANLPDVSEGLDTSLKNAANSCNTLKELINIVKSKRFTQTRIQRILLYALLGIDKKQMDISKKINPYIRVLGFNAKGKQLISEMLKINPKLPVITSVKKYMDLLPNKNLKEMLNRDIFAGNVYTLGYEMDSWANLDYTNKIITM